MHFSKMGISSFSNAHCPFLPCPALVLPQMWVLPLTLHCPWRPIIALANRLLLKHFDICAISVERCAQWTTWAIKICLSKSLSCSFISNTKKKKKIFVFLFFMTDWHLLFYPHFLRPVLVCPEHTCPGRSCQSTQKRLSSWSKYPLPQQKGVRM